MAVSLFTDEDLNILVQSNVKKEIAKDVTTFGVSLDLQTEQLLTGVRQFVNSHQDLTKKEILKQLEDQQENMTGVFSVFKKSVVQDYAVKVFRVDEAVFFGDVVNNIDDGNISYTWQAIMVKTCPSCISLHGSSKTLNMWDATGGRPRTRPTLCGHRCKCSLIPSAVMPTKKEMQRPVKIAAERVRRAEKKRGKNYSTSYEKQLVGQYNSPTNRLKDLRKIKKVKT